MNGKRILPLEEIAAYPEEPKIQAANVVGDPVLRGVRFLVGEFQAVHEGQADVRRERRLEGLLRTAQKPFHPSEDQLADVFGQETWSDLRAAWVIVKALAQLFRRIQSGEALDIETALEGVIEAAAATLAFANGAVGVDIARDILRPVIKAMAGESAHDELQRVTESLITRPVRPEQFAPTGNVKKMRGFIRKVGKNRQLDKPGSSTLRKYRGKGIDTTNPDAVDAERHAGARRQRGIAPGYFSLREIAANADVAYSTMRDALKRAHARGEKIGQTMPGFKHPQYSEADAKKLRKYIDRRTKDGNLED